MEATVNSNLSFLVAEIFVFLNYSKIVLLRQENIRIMLAVLLLEKGQKLCSIPQIMPKIMLAQSARAYPRATHFLREKPWGRGCCEVRSKGLHFERFEKLVISQTINLQK